MLPSIKETPLQGCLELEPNIFVDNRGSLVKIFHEDFFRDQRIDFELKELYHTQSKQGVLRGMHFQSPPAQHSKIVFCPAGKVLDVVVDLRRGAPTYGECYSTVLSAEKKNALYVPVGLAHGFLSLADDTLMVYMVSSVYNPAHDCGIRYDSFGFDWGVETPILSARDAKLPPFEEAGEWFG
jgi:dTDP-4-dehydrorhamnose 3,5-epimerase